MSNDAYTYKKGKDESTPMSFQVLRMLDKSLTLFLQKSPTGVAGV
jgi:hypothetical protein